MIIKKILTPGLFLLLMLFPVVAGIVTPQLVSAQVEGKWINRSQIEANGKTLIDQNPYDSNHEYKSSFSESCSDTLKAFPDRDNGTKADYTKKAKGADGKCNESTEQAILGNESEKWVNAYRIGNDETITLPQIAVPAQSSLMGTLTKITAVAFSVVPGGTTATVFLWKEAGNIQSTGFSGQSSPEHNGVKIVTGPVSFRVIPESDPQDPLRDRNKFYLIDPESDTGYNTDVYIDLAQKKQFSGSASLNLTFWHNGEIMPEEEASDIGVPGSDSNPEPSCEASGFGLAWVFCPLIEGLANASDAVYEGIIQPMLKGDTIDASPTSPVYKAWSQFRIYANILLVIALLVVVFGQAIGGGLIDAYTAKKMLPRILLAAVLINLSIYIVAFAVDVTNIVGAGLRSMIATPFEGLSNVVLSGGTGVVLGASLGIGATVLGAFAIGNLGATLSFLALFILLPGFLAIVSVMFTLILRQALLYFLIFVSPLAFAAFVLPNTEKLFKTWWNYLYKALLVYIVIEVVFAMSFVMSKILNMRTGAGGITGTLGALTSIVVLLMPLFLIPFAFKLAGGVIGSLYGTLSGVGKKTGEAIKGNPNDQNSLRNRTKKNARAGYIKNKAQYVRSTGAFDPDSTNGRFKKLSGRAVNRLSGDLFGDEAQINQEGQARLDAISGNGDDVLINARSAVKNSDGDWITLDGEKTTEAAVKAAARLYPTLGHLQRGIGYRLGKAGTSEAAQTFKKNAGKLKATYGLSEQQLSGPLTGVGFGIQDSRLEFKHAGFGDAGAEEAAEYGAEAGDYGYLAVKNPKMDGLKDDGTVGINHETKLPKGKNFKFNDELHNVKGASWKGSQMHAATFEHAARIQKHWEEKYRTATSDEQRNIYGEALRKMYSTGDTLSTRASTPTGQMVMGEDGSPMEGLGGASGAAPATKDAIGRLVDSQDAAVKAAVTGRPAAPPPQAPQSQTPDDYTMD